MWGGRFSRKDGNSSREETLSPGKNVSDRILKPSIKIEILGLQDGSMCKLLSGQVWQPEFGSCSPNEVERRD